MPLVMLCAGLQTHTLYVMTARSMHVSSTCSPLPFPLLYQFTDHDLVPCYLHPLLPCSRAHSKPMHPPTWARASQPERHWLSTCLLLRMVILPTGDATPQASLGRVMLLPRCRSTALPLHTFVHSAAQIPPTRVYLGCRCPGLRPACRCTMPPRYNAT